MSLIVEDGKKDEVLVPSKAKAASLTKRRRRKAQERQKKEKKKEELADVHPPLEGHAKAYKGAGLPSKGFWFLSHRNRARRISQLEVEPDQSKLIMFDLREGYL